MTTDKYELALNKQMAERIDRAASEGHQVPVDEDLAAYMGAFEEDALSSDEALESKATDQISRQRKS